MTTTRTGTWAEAKFGLAIKAKDQSIWTLVGCQPGPPITVTMQSVDDIDRKVVVHPESWETPIEIVEDTSWVTEGSGLVVAGVPLTPAPDLAAPSPSTPGIEHAKATLEQHKQALKDDIAAKTAWATEQARRATAGEPMMVPPMSRPSGEPPTAPPAQVNVLGAVHPPYVAPMPDLQPPPPPLAPSAPANEQPEPQAPGTVEVAPIQPLGEVWPVQPVDGATVGEMHTHMVLFHGTWTQDIAKKGKALLTELHRLHAEKHAEPTNAGIGHVHSEKETQAQ